jgi:RNA polymerase sigma-70 factor (ECF subfamily)
LGHPATVGEGRGDRANFSRGEGRGSLRSVDLAVEFAAMGHDPTDAREAPIRRRSEEGDFDGAATLAVRLYGPEIFGFLLAVHRREEDASDVFSLWSERLWRTLGSFAWQCSLRTWAYVLARSVSSRFRQTEAKRAQRQVPLSACAALSEIAAQVRTETLSFLATERQSEIQRLRESLSPEDRALIILRIDRGLAFSELARIFLENEQDGAEGAREEGAPAADQEALQREAARLRKRFQLVKQRLLALAKERGLFHVEEG